MESLFCYVILQKKKHPVDYNYIPELWIILPIIELHWKKKKKIAKNLTTTSSAATPSSIASLCATYHHNTISHKLLTIKPLLHLVKICALGWPHGSSSQTQDQSSGYQSVELRVELSCHVGGVAEDTEDQGPLHLEVLDQDAGHEHAGENQTDIHCCQGPGTKIVNLNVQQYDHIALLK